MSGTVRSFEAEKIDVRCRKKRIGRPRSRSTFSCVEMDDRKARERVLAKLDGNRKSQKAEKWE